jgi:hypothetical protein
MRTRIELRQTKSVVEGPDGSVYVTKNEITYALNIPREVFVFTTEAQEFSNVASVWQLQNLPVGQTNALEVNSDYYRLDTAEVGYPSVDTAIAFAAHVQARVDGLLREYVKSGEQFEGTTDHTYTVD